MKIPVILRGHRGENLSTYFTFLDQGIRGRSEALCQASLACFLIKRWQVVSGLFHDLYDLVERHTVVTIGERGVDIGVEGTAGSESVTLDTWYLHESADRVACHTEMMLQSHLRRIFYL